MKVVAVVQARLGSSRLPGKCLRVLAGKPMIDHVLMRATAISGLACVVLATSVHARDEALADYVARVWPNVRLLRGSESDVLSRYLLAAELTEAEVIMRLTGDCPFLCPAVAAEVLSVYFDNPLGAEYVSNDTLSSGYPDGTDVEVFSRRLLDASSTHATETADLEHVTRWMRRVVLTATLKSDIDMSQHKLSVDSVEDYAFAARLADRLPNNDLTLQATMAAIAALEP